MRVAPVGLFYPKDIAFDRAVDIAALTHGHSSGYLSAGALAYIIASIIEGVDIKKALLDALKKLETYENHQECYKSLAKATELSDHKTDTKKALFTSVNHDGDSDSTGAITGNILGVYLGVNEIPNEWINNV